MKLIPEKLEELKAMAEHARSPFSVELAEAFVNYVPALITALEEAQSDRETSELMNKAFRHHLVVRDTELAETRKQLTEAARIGATWQLAEAQALFFNISEDTPCKCKEHSKQAEEFLKRTGHKALDSILDAAIAEAIADEKRNPWKQAIINELAVSHVLHTDHETDPVRALAALVDYECKAALDPAVSKEAQELIEPYRKDAERVDWLEQQGHAYGFHGMHEGNRWVVEGPFATLRQLADAAKVENE